MATADELNIKPNGQHLLKDRPRCYSGDRFGDFIRQRRADLGLSLRQVEERSGIHNSRLSRWERGEQRPETADLLPALAQALDLPVAEVCQRADHGLTRTLPHLGTYLHTKYGRHLPPDVLHELIDHCETVLTAHNVATTNVAPA